MATVLEVAEVFFATLFVVEDFFVSVFATTSFFADVFLATDFSWLISGIIELMMKKIGG